MIKQVNGAWLLLLGAIALFLNGCSTAPVYNAANLPKIPEISGPITPKYAPPKKVVKKPYQPEVRRYTIKSSIEREYDNAERKERLIQAAKKRASIDVDPYAAIPSSSSSRKEVVSKKNTARKLPSASTDTSPAVKSLLILAQADLAIGKRSAAITKLERGLRIEPKNPKLWNVLAKAHFDQADYPQAISMAKKSISYTNNQYILAKNWTLIKKAGEKSGDTMVVKEALDFFKVNP